jgi:hypothetical protein
MGDDVGALVNAISSYVGNSSVAIIASPQQAVRIAMYSPDQASFTLLMSSALAAGTVVAIATNALVGAIEPVRLDAAKSLTVHEEDTSPLPVGSASPGRSLWQTDSVALRMILPATWVVRDARAVASVVTTKW